MNIISKKLCNTKFVFVFTPPFSGSTALAKILNTSPKSMLLNSRGEGQWMIPGMRKPNPWNPEKKINWKRVKVRWMERVLSVESLVGQISIVIEKSPPNLVRYKNLLDNFPNHELIVYNRNPYANCSSTFHRLHVEKNLTSKERQLILQKLAEDWLYRSRICKRIIDSEDVLFFTYERLCSNPEKVVKSIISRIPDLVKIDHTLEIQVKDYPSQRLRNFNTEQINKLSKKEKDMISEVLNKEGDLINFFGYTLV